LFRDWFVTFGPTRAKLEGYAPYLSGELWELFPTSFDDDDKPSTWRTDTLSSVAASPRVTVRPSEVTNDTPYIGLEHMPRHSVALTDWEGSETVTSNKAEFRKGEFLFGKLRPYFHKVGIAPINGICSTDIVVIRPKSDDWASFVLACISSDTFVAYTDRTSTGTKMPRTKWQTMGQYVLCLPQPPVARAFQDIVGPMLDRIIANIHESRTLAATREFLLPKLISGHIRLREAEKAVEAVA
jgi:type I restriction enzyme S subunit